jgi:hypothetical protein
MDADDIKWDDIKWEDGDNLVIIFNADPNVEPSDDWCDIDSIDLEDLEDL